MEVVYILLFFKLSCRKYNVSHFILYLSFCIYDLFIININKWSHVYFLFFSFYNIWTTRSMNSFGSLRPIMKLGLSHYFNLKWTYLVNNIVIIFIDLDLFVTLFIYILFYISLQLSISRSKTLYIYFFCTDKTHPQQLK